MQIFYILIYNYITIIVNLKFENIIKKLKQLPLLKNKFNAVVVRFVTLPGRIYRVSFTVTQLKNEPGPSEMAAP